MIEDGVYVYGPSGLPIEQINNSTGAVEYLHHDQQGSTRLLTGSTGKTEATFTYGPYGTLTGSTGTATTPLGYDGQYTSSDTGLIYMRARTYDPATAQFLTRDLLASLTREPYAYAVDNPLNLGDPTGYEAIPFPIGGAGGEAAGGAALCGDPVTATICAGAAGYGAYKAGESIYNAWAGSEGGDEGEAELKQKEAERENEQSCGNSATPPGSKFEWNGKGEPGSEEGSWFDPETEEYLRPHFKPSSHGSHWDYRAPDGSEWRIYPEGRIEPKL